MRHRFHALCPYFAMFPETFAEQWITKLTKKGDVVLDPFCGRGTLPFQALLMDRQSIGCDTNPVAYCISRAKTAAPILGRVLKRLDELAVKYDASREQRLIDQLPEFFAHAYHRQTLAQLSYLRRNLHYDGPKTDCMIAAIVLGALHGEMDRSERFLSNQMPHTISTKPEYSIRFWKRRHQKPPKRDAFQLIRSQLSFRYETGRPEREGQILRLDMRELPRHRSKIPSKIGCVITSPPYFDVTDYGEDQWLRLWFLGGESRPRRQEFSRDDRHTSLDQYWGMLADMWRSLGLVLDSKAHVVVRLGATRIGPRRLVDGLEGVARAANRKVRLVEYQVSELVKRQTDAFRPGSKGCKVEVDCHFSMA